MLLRMPKSIMLKNLPSMLLGIPETFIYYALYFPHYACVMLKDYSIFKFMNVLLKYFLIVLLENVDGAI